MDTAPGMAWLIVASAFVLFMTPGLALFYGGMVRSKNLLNMLMMNVICMGIVPLAWVIVGYSLISGVEGQSFIGGFDYVGMKTVGADGELLLGAMYGLTFAVITPALISGAVADRLKFKAWMLFVPLWVLLVYVPVGYWVWAPEGFLLERGSLDFAGGLVVHINAGVAALVFVLLLGKRKGWPTEAMKPHSLPLTLLGAGILWMGWFGFNGGAAAGDGAIAGMTFYNTFIAAAAGMIGWLIVETIKDGHPTTLGAASGLVAGLVCITPACAYVGGLAPVAMGLIAGVLCYLAIQLKYKFGYDDSLDVVGVHMVGGLIGTLLIGFFADKAVNPVVAESPGGGGLFFGGNGELLFEQAFAAVVVLVFSGAVTFAIVKVIDLLVGIRVSEDDEAVGLDQSQHSETAYNLIEA